MARHVPIGVTETSAMNLVKSPHLLGTTLSALLLASACSSGPQGTSSQNPVPGDPGAFESDDPTGASNNRGQDDGGIAVGTGGTASAGTGGSGGSGGSATPAPEAPGDGSRAIEEADIVKIEEGKLYALSRYGGLSVIDVSVRDQL